MIERTYNPRVVLQNFGFAVQDQDDRSPSPADVERGVVLIKNEDRKIYDITIY
jgi:hypothetical protein